MCYKYTLGSRRPNVFMSTLFLLYSLLLFFFFFNKKANNGNTGLCAEVRTPQTNKHQTTQVLLLAQLLISSQCQATFIPWFERSQTLQRCASVRASWRKPRSRRITHSFITAESPYKEIKASAGELQGHSRCVCPLSQSTTHINFFFLLLLKRERCVWRA